MKFVFTLLLISFSTIAFSQMTFTELVKIYKMDMDQFEEYAISRGYEFYKLHNEETIKGVSYVKGFKKETKYLTLHDVYFFSDKHVSFQTGSSSELLRIKSEMKKSGYTLNKSYYFENNKVDEYRKGEFEVGIYTIPPDEENKEVRYEINLNKF